MLTSVLITAYRRRAFLLGAVDSVLSQTLPRGDYEVVVVKDWADPSVDAEWESRGVRLLIEDIPVVGQMLRAGLRQCRGDVVCFLDDDDTFRPSKLEHVRSAFEADPELVFLRNGFEPVDRAGAPAPAFRRVLPQPRAPFAFRADRATARDFSRVVKTRAYGNLSTFSVRRASIAEREDALVHVEACTDSSVATIMLDAAGRHRFVPQVWTARRVGTSLRSLGKGAEARRAIRTLEYLRSQSRSPVARRYADMFLSWARVDAFLNSEDGRLSFPEWLTYVRYHLPRLDADTWETEAWSFGKRFAPRLVASAYRRRREGWATASAPGSPPSEPRATVKP